LLLIKSKVKDKVLHLVCRAEEFTEERTEIVAPNHFIQCAFLKLPEGKTFRPHQHIWKAPYYKEVIAQESWVVIRGKVKVFFYDTDGALLQTEELSAGDASFTLEGGHTYEILEESTLVYEYKTGPYEGQEKDKVFL